MIPALAPRIVERRIDLRYISLGAGVQSTALLALAQDGRFGDVECAIFADTGDEPAFVYEHLDWLERWSQIPIRRVSAGVLSEDLLAKLDGARSRAASIPAYTTGADGAAAPLRRQCTRDYKITPIEREARRLLGFKKGERIKGRATAEALIGISTDEATRMKPSSTSWTVNRYPLIELNLSREACLRVIREMGLPEPQKSACVFCPYHSDAYWRWLKTEHPGEWDRALVFDGAIRDMTRAGVRAPVFLHRSRVPLAEVKLKPKAEQMSMDLFDEECEGMCGL